MAPQSDVRRAVTDLAEACKLIAQMLSMQSVSKTKSKRRLTPAPSGTPNTAGGTITNLRPNEVTGNGFIPRDSSNYRKRALR